MEAAEIAGRELREPRGGGRRDAVEDAEQRIGKPELVAGDQLGIVEVVAGIHAHALRQPPAHGDFLALRQERDFHPVDLVGMVGDDREAGLHRLARIGRAPIA